MAESHTFSCDACGKTWNANDNHKMRNTVTLVTVDSAYGNKSFNPPPDEFYDLCHACVKGLRIFLNGGNSGDRKPDRYRSVVVEEAP